MDAAPVKVLTVRKSRCPGVPADRYGIFSIRSLSPGGAFLGPTQLF